LLRLFLVLDIFLVGFVFVILSIGRGRRRQWRVEGGKGEVGNERGDWGGRGGEGGVRLARMGWRRVGTLTESKDCGGEEEEVGLEGRDGVVSG